MENLTIEQFNALPREQKAVLVAKDVITQVEINRYRPSSGSYIRFRQPINRDNDVKKNFGEIDRCRVCAIGACLLSTAHYADSLTFGDVGDVYDSYRNTVNKKSVNELAEVFEPHQIMLIETAFEGIENSYVRIARLAFGEELSTEEEILCENFFTLNAWDDDERMIAIMQNIIDNNGKFTL